jgi:alkylated DNA repair dioxygenase AlkB
MERYEIAPESYLDLYRDWVVEDTDTLFSQLLTETPWEQKTIKMYGKEVLQPRLTAWYGSRPYTYSGRRNEPTRPTPTLARFMVDIEDLVDTEINSVLCNLYRNGQDSVGMHADDEPELGKNPVIGSLSLGATRTFVIQPKVKGGGLSMSFELHSGDLLIMRGRTQSTHKHGVPKESKVTEARINLTFRNILPVGK